MTKFSNKNKSAQSGLALIMLTVFVSIGLVIATMATALAINSFTGSSLLDRSFNTIRAAESGADEALLRLVRDPSYAGGTLTVDAATVTITVTGSSPKTIDIVSDDNFFVRKLRLITTETNGITALQSWSEVY